MDARLQEDLSPLVGKTIVSVERVGGDTIALGLEGGEEMYLVANREDWRLHAILLETGEDEADAGPAPQKC